MRSVPSSITALLGQAVLRAPLFLVKWELASGTVYFSSGEAVTYGGNSYAANRVKSISGLTSQYVDRKSKDWGRASIVFDNMPATIGAALPFQTLDAAGNLEDRRISVYLYFPDATDAVLVFWGFSGPPKFSDLLDDPTCEISASFIWDSEAVVIPAMTLPEAGFATLESNTNSESSADEFVIPLVYGVSNIQIRPTIYAHRVEGDYLHVNFIVSGCAEGFPFDANDVPAADMRIFKNTVAVEVEFITGSFTQTAPANLTRFPDGEAHAGIAYGYAAFPITEQTKDRLDDLEPDEIKMVLVNGRPLIDTELPSENPALILKDILRDPNFGLGLADGDFDAAAVDAAADYCSGSYASRLEIHERLPVGDLVQRICTEISGFLTFNNGKIQIGCKTNAESAVAQFSTIDSGFSYRKIHLDDVSYEQESADNTVNELQVTYRKKNRHRRKIHAFDPVAQARPGANIKKVISEELELLSLYDENEAAIAAATYLREEQSANLFITFRTPVIEGLLPAPGDIIEVRSPRILNNATNRFFRIIAQTPEIDDEALMSFKCRVYHPAVYDYTTDGIGVDIIRGSEGTSSQGRPPDVTPVSLEVVDTGADDAEGRQATVRAAWTYPTVDTAGELTDNNVAREYPISAVQLWVRYTNESFNEARLAKEVAYPVAQADFLIDWHKNRSIECFFIALGHNRSRARLGYIPDPTKTTVLTANLSATAASASVTGVTGFAANDFVFIEREIAKLTAGAPSGTTLNFVTSGGNRAAQLSTTAIAHPSGTEIAVAKPSYPSLVIPLTAPRYTYKTVSGLTARQRGDGVRFTWVDPSADNLEKFLFYWSTDGDAGSNAAKLGTSTPSWYTTDPNSPPAGVNLLIVDTNQYKLLQEVIGAAGTTVYARVAARNGKHNFSPQLSVLASNNSSGATVPPNTAPATPQLSAINVNEVNLATAVADARLVFRVFADPTGTMTFAQTGATEVHVGLLADGETETEHYPFVIDDLSATFADVVIILTLGRKYAWKWSLAKNGAGKLKSAVVTVNFFAGGKATDASLITGLAITSITNQDSRTTRINYTYTQPATPVLLANAKALKKLPADVSFFKAGKDSVLDEESQLTAGVKTDSIEVKTPKATNIDWRIRLTAVDGTTIESATFNATSPDEDIAAPAGIFTPVLKYQNGDLAVKNLGASANLNTLDHYDVVIAGYNSVGTFLGYIETTNWTFTASETTAKTNVGRAGKMVFNVRVEQLVTAFGATGQFRAYFYAVNAVGTSSASGLSNIITIASIVDPVGNDSAIPTLASPSAPQVSEFHGVLTVACPTPSANINTLDEFQVVLSTSNTAPAADPTVGSEGVVKIHKGQTVTFKAKQGDTSSLWAYYRARNVKGYSVWSSGGNLGVPGRPLTDFIGTGVPVLSEEEVRSANSGTGHSTTVVILDSGASSVNDFYNGMHLYIAALGQFRRIVDYVGSTRAAHAETAFGSTPANNTPYKIFRGSVGYENNNQTGAVRGAPFRFWLDGDTNEVVIEGIPPAGENSFSLTEWQIQIVRLNNGNIKFDQKINLATTSVFRFTPPNDGAGYTPVARIRWRNMYREGGSDGWSAWSYYVELPKGTGGGGLANYDPNTYAPPEVDFLDDANYPTSRYPTF